MILFRDYSTGLSSVLQSRACGKGISTTDSICQCIFIDFTFFPSKTNSLVLLSIQLKKKQT